MLPAITLLVLFFINPVIMGFSSSLSSSAFKSDTKEFVGLDNYIVVMKDPRFWNSFFVSVNFTGSIALLSSALGLFFAIYLVKKPKYYLFCITVAFIPYITSPVIGSLVWRNMLGEPFGIVNAVLQSIGFNTFSFLKTKTMAMLTVIAIQVWYTFGFNAVLYMAGLQAIPTEYYEAAELEGCGFFGTLIHITLPLIIPTIVIAIIISVLYGFVNSYILTNLVTGGGPFEATYVLISYMFELAFDRYDLPKANAVTILIFILFCTMALLQLHFQKKRFAGLH